MSLALLCTRWRCNAISARPARRWLAAVCMAVGVALIPLTSAAQSASFAVQSSTNGNIIYQSGSYRTMQEAVVGMYSYVRQRWASGSLFAYWYASGSVYPREITFRVPPVKPVSYKSNYATLSGSTPEAACNQIALTDPRVIVRRTYMVDGGRGLNQWYCEFDVSGVPETDCQFQGNCIWWNILSITCDPLRQVMPNDDLHGEAMCGFALHSFVASSDATPDKPDECPEGNPIVPSSAQKTHHEVDYDDGRFLKVSRTYGSQRFSPISGGYSPWSSTFLEGLTIAPQELAGAAYLGNGTVARIYSDRFSGTISPMQGDMPYRGRVTVVNGVATGYTLYSPFASYVDEFDGQGRLLRRTNADGSYQAMTYTINSSKYPASAPTCSVATPTPRPFLQCVSDPFGRQLTYEWNASGFRTKLIDPAGGVVQFAYDGPTSYYNPAVRGPFGNLTSVTRQDGTVRLYHYNEPENTENVDQYTMLTGISDQAENGSMVRYATYKYSAIGLAVQSERAGGTDRHAVTYSYGPRTVQSATVTRPLGTTFTHNYIEVQNAARKVSTAQPPGAGSLACSDSKTYDSLGNITSRVDFNGNKTCYVYDQARKLERQRVEGVAADVDCSTALSSPPAGARLIQTQWHPTWPLKTAIAEPKRITTLVYNGQNASCAPNTVLADGKPPAVVCSKTEQATTDTTGTSGFNAGLDGPPRTWTYTYATFGRVLTATDPNGRTSITAYHPDDDPDLGRRGNVASVTNAAGHVTRFTAYNLHGQPTQIVDPNGLVTDLTYDARMRLMSRKVGSQVMTLTYTPAGKVKTITLPDGSSVTNTYDAAHRLVAVQDQKGNRADYTLDPMGNRTYEQAKDPNGVLERNIQRSIDALNRVQQIVGLE